MAKQNTRLAYYSQYVSTDVKGLNKTECGLLGYLISGNLLTVCNGEGYCVTNKKICEHFDISSTALYNSRLKLVRMGLIRYIAGHRDNGVNVPSRYFVDFDRVLNRDFAGHKEYKLKKEMLLQNNTLKPMEINEITPQCDTLDLHPTKEVAPQSYTPTADVAFNELMAIKQQINDLTAKVESIAEMLAPLAKLLSNQKTGTLLTSLRMYIDKTLSDIVDNSNIYSRLDIDMVDKEDIDYIEIHTIGEDIPKVTETNNIKSISSSVNNGIIEARSLSTSRSEVNKQVGEWFAEIGKYQREVGTYPTDEVERVKARLTDIAREVKRLKSESRITPRQYDKLVEMGKSVRSAIQSIGSKATSPTPPISCSQISDIFTEVDEVTSQYTQTNDPYQQDELRERVKALAEQFNTCSSTEAQRYKFTSMLRTFDERVAAYTTTYVRDIVSGELFIHISEKNLCFDLKSLKSLLERTLGKFSNDFIEAHIKDWLADRCYTQSQLDEVEALKADIISRNSFTEKDKDTDNAHTSDLEAAGDDLGTWVDSLPFRHGEIDERPLKINPARCEVYRGKEPNRPNTHRPEKISIFFLFFQNPRYL